MELQRPDCFQLCRSSFLCKGWKDGRIGECESSVPIESFRAFRIHFLASLKRSNIYKRGGQCEKSILFYPDD